jgi:hypothetical protein
MRKKTLLTLLLTLLGMSTWAAEAKIVVWLNDGNKTEVLFSEMPEFTYQDGNVSVQSAGTTLSWPLASLQKFTFEDIEPSKTTDIGDVKNSPKLDIVKGCAVYDLSGRLVKKQIRSLSELPQGTYIIKDGSVTTKVVKR